MLIRNKLILRFATLVVAIQLLFSVFIYYVNALYREQEFYSRLVGKARLTARLLIKRDLLTGSFITTIKQGDLITLPDEQISLYNQAGKLIYANNPTYNPRTNLPYLRRLSGVNYYPFRLGKVESVGLRYPHQGKDYYIFASGLDESGYAKLENMALILVVGNVATLVLIIIAGWYFASKALEPISEVIQEVDTITASRLDFRVKEGNQKDEIAKLAMTFNKMLDRVQQAFESQKSFVSHASHELRTPLTNALGTLEICLAYDQDMEDARLSISSSVEEIKKLIDLTNGLLSLAKAEGQSFKKELIRVDECTMEALIVMRTKYPNRSIPFRFGKLPLEEDVFTIPGNGQLLQTALVNILDNACKYSQGAVQVEVGYEKPRGLYFRVQDEGIGIAPEELSHIFSPLYRGTNSKAQSGYGIGLAVTQKIIQWHQGHLQVTSRLGAGTTMKCRGVVVVIPIF